MIWFVWIFKIGGIAKIVLGQSHFYLGAFEQVLIFSGPMALKFKQWPISKNTISKAKKLLSKTRPKSGFSLSENYCLCWSSFKECFRLTFQITHFRHSKKIPPPYTLFHISKTDIRKIEKFRPPYKAGVIVANRCIRF